MAKNLTVTDDRVKKAAESCPDAKRVLTELFPEVFAPQVQYVVPTNGAATSIGLSVNGKKTAYNMQQRNGGEYSEKGFYLPKTTGFGAPNIEWSVRKDREDEFVLIGEVKS